MCGFIAFEVREIWFWFKLYLEKLYLESADRTLTKFERATSNDAQDGSRAKEREGKLKSRVANWESIWLTILQDFASDSIFDCLLEFSVTISDFVNGFQRRSGNSVSDVYWQ